MEEVVYKYFEPQTIDGKRQIYEYFKIIGRGSKISGQVINKEKGVFESSLYMAPIPDTIGQAVVAFLGDTPIGVICCDNPKIKNLVSNTTHVVSEKFRGLGIGRGLERELMNHIQKDFKITAYAGSSAAEFHVRDKNSWRIRFKFTSKGSLMMDVYHKNPNAKNHYGCEDFLWEDAYDTYESQEVREFVEKYISDPDPRFNALRNEVAIAKSFGQNL